MYHGSTLGRFIIGVAVALAALMCALPTSAAPGRVKGQPSAAAIAAWSASYRAKESAYRAELAARAEQRSLSPAAIQAWSDDYRAKWDLYQQQQVAQAEREAAAFNFSDAVIGGGIVLGVGALVAAWFCVIRGRRIDAVTS
jgi:hypothetical protein